MKLKKYAAIDIGSNAVRLMIANVIKKKNDFLVKKVDLIRLPIRLGADVFVEGSISSSNYRRMKDAMMAFKHLMKVHGITDYRAFATSAMRSAANGIQLADEILRETAIKIDIINGKKEASIIFATKLASLIKKDKAYIYIDVGGGSTEMTIYSKGEIIAAKSFKIGTVRILNDLVDYTVWEKIENWVKDQTQGIDDIEAIGSGGNINKIFKMSGRADGEPLSRAYLFAQLNYLKSFTYNQRIEELGLNEDRADVIVPATKIYLSAMKWSGAEIIHVPKIGLVDGIIQSLHKGEI
jgi:exopolyphosphatase/guanosine-5'-triphosphate,3'-diphosphate pyrophosphatase